jgi:hypothetical protein
MDLTKVFREIILLNELGGNEALAYRFSDPDGVRTGKSGWSFGLCQFDLSNNGLAAVCLKECGFRSVEIAALKAQTIRDMGPMDAWLGKHREIVARWDDAQLQSCITRAREMALAGGWSYADDRALLCAADYHNQLFISKGRDFFTWAKSLARPVTDYDIHKFRRNQPWGQKRPDDVDRRYHNIITVAVKYGL